MQNPDHVRAIALHVLGLLTIPLCYGVMLSVVLTAARRPPAAKPFK